MLKTFNTSVYSHTNVTRIVKPPYHLHEDPTAASDICNETFARIPTREMYMYIMQS